MNQRNRSNQMRTLSCLVSNCRRIHPRGWSGVMTEVQEVNRHQAHQIHEALVNDGSDVALGDIDIWLNIDDPAPTNAILSDAEIVASVTKIRGGIESDSENGNFSATRTSQNSYFEGSSCWFRGGLSMSRNSTDNFGQNYASAELNNNINESRTSTK